MYASVGQLGDPPLLFALGSFAFVFGYGAWHTVLDHGPFWPHLGSHESHGGTLVAIVFEHRFGDTLVSATAEVALIGCLFALYHTAVPRPSE